jgi:prepilin-type N-terminal cleavage/methylation domain-containing protein
MKPMLTARAPGFTLIEMLVVISIIAIVLSLSFAGLARAKTISKQIRLDTLAAQHTAAMIAYSSEHRDSWPCLMPPASPGVDLVIMERVMHIEYFDQHWAWPAMMTPGTLGGTIGHPMYTTCNRVRTRGNDFFYSPTFLTSPEYWTWGRRIVGSSQWRGTRADEVRFPSAKAIICCIHKLGNHRCGGDFTERSATLGYVDGSAATISNWEGTSLGGYPGGVGRDDGGLLDIVFPGMSTMEGVFGRDR